MTDYKPYDFGTDAIIIARVSTPDQVLDEDSSPQLSDLKAYATALGCKRLQAFGTTESGFLKEDEKQGWNQVTNFIAQNPSFRTVICTEMSRLGRDEEVLIHIKNYLVKNRIQLLIKDINFELLNRYGDIDQGKDIVFSLYASFASAEMRQKKERFKRARTEYKKLGYSIGGKQLFGYTRVCDGKLGKKNTYIIKPDEAEQIKTIYEWYLGGIDHDLTITSIARITYECRARGFNHYLHSKRNVNKCLKESAYTGFKITNNKQKNAQYWNYKQMDAPKYIQSNQYECSYPRILSHELFQQVQDKLSKESTHNAISNNVFVDKSRKHITILSKILRCPQCGNFFIGDYRIKDGFIKHTYRCNASKGALLRKCVNAKTISMTMLDSSVWAFVKEKVEEITAKMSQRKNDINVDSIKEEIMRLSDSFNKLDDEIDTVSNIYAAKVRISGNKVKAKEEFDRKIVNIEKERKRIESLIDSRKRLLTTATEASASMNLDELIKSNIASIESAKNEMYKYIHLLIKSVIPLYTDRQNTILEIIAFENFSEVLEFGKEDANGLPMITGEKRDNVYYVCIDKSNANAIKARLINDNQITFDMVSEQFCLYDRIFSIADIWAVDTKETDPSKYIEWQKSISDLPYQKLTFYGEDERIKNG